MTANKAMCIRERRPSLFRDEKGLRLEAVQQARVSVRVRVNYDTWRIAGSGEAETNEMAEQVGLIDS